MSQLKGNYKFSPIEWEGDLRLSGCPVLHTVLEVV